MSSGAVGQGVLGIDGYLISITVLSFDSLMRLSVRHWHRAAASKAIEPRTRPPNVRS